jgi:hypothetical protein
MVEFLNLEVGVKLEKAPELQGQKGLGLLSFGPTFPKMAGYT